MIAAQLGTSRDAVCAQILPPVPSSSSAGAGRPGPAWRRGPHPGCQNRDVVTRASGAADPRTVGWTDPSPSVADVGEDQLLAHLMAAAAQPAPDLPIPAGDDAAGWLPPLGATVVVTTDALVEDIDFRRAYQGPYAVGWKAYAVNASDLAAMGATPQLVVVTLLLPEATASGAVLALQLGIADAARVDGARVAGGDLSATRDRVAVSCTAIGTAAPARLLQRTAGRPGDLLLVTGTIGGAAAALCRLEAGAAPAAVPWADRLLRPVARVAAGRALADAGVRCAIDCSDGLLLDTSRLARASGCGAELWADRIPLAAGLDAVWSASPLLPAVTGGEDFELIAAAPSRIAEGLVRGAGWAADLPALHVIGRLRRAAGLTLRTRMGGPPVKTGPTRGYTHFRGGTD